MSAQDRGWGAGWPSCRNRTPPLVTVTTGGSRIRLSVRREIAVLVSRLVTHLELASRHHFGRNSGGYNCRPIAGTSSPSNHSWGLAVDLDSHLNPQMSRSAHAARGHRYPGGRVLVSNMPQNAAAIAARYGFGWGGHYVSKPDPMHFEFVGRPSDAAHLTRTTEVNDVGKLEGSQSTQLSNADRRTRAILELLRDEGSNATVGRRTREMTIILRSLAGTDDEAELEKMLASGTDVRELLKTLVEGAVLDGLRPRHDDFPQRGLLREPFKDLMHEVLSERDLGEQPADEPANGTRVTN
jgi:hypothetical protein